MKYIIKVDGQQITKPMTLEQIINTLGPIRDLERTGHVLVPVN